MTGLSRRDFLSLSGSAAVAAMAGPAGAAMGPNDKFDLVIKGGDVLDPSQSLKGKSDIGIRWGVVEAIEADIPAARAAKTIDASGKLVTPGLVDLHCHVYPYGSAIGIPADELVQFQCTTTVVSAGDGDDGAGNASGLDVGFQRCGNPRQPFAGQADVFGFGARQGIVGECGTGREQAKRGCKDADRHHGGLPFRALRPLLVGAEPMARQRERPALPSFIFAWADGALTRPCLRKAGPRRIITPQKNISGGGLP